MFSPANSLKRMVYVWLLVMGLCVPIYANEKNIINEVRYSEPHKKSLMYPAETLPAQHDMFSQSSNGLASQPVHCHPILWPSSSSIMQAKISIPNALLEQLIKNADRALSKSIHAIPTLSSAGKVDITDPALIMTRKALEDADRAAILAMAYRITHQEKYLKKTVSILQSWANINQPTGHPIDETRLDGMIWAYDLIACDLNDADKHIILTWFKKIQQKKLAWSFGPKTSKNNHRIHQLKMVLLLDKLFNDTTNWQQHVKKAQYYSHINLLDSGKSIDFMERDAIYYHNYVLQPWIEISLISGCCRSSIINAFTFLKERILGGPTKSEFLHSSAPIDHLRDAGGFSYAKQGRSFNPRHAIPTIICYETLINETSDAQLAQIIQTKKNSPHLSFLTLRKLLWVE